jgi:ABC-type phosphate/phosphonate transport system permease subunit
VRVPGRAEFLGGWLPPTTKPAPAVMPASRSRTVSPAVRTLRTSVAPFSPIDLKIVYGAGRSVPDVVFALIFVTAVGLGPSLVLGLVGAGGIGFLINQSIKLFRFDEMVTHILVVLLLVVVVDQASGFVRKRLGA